MRHSLKITLLLTFCLLAAPPIARLRVEGPTAAAFRRHPATVELFVDGQSIGTPLRKASDVVKVAIHRGGNVSRASANWNSDWGPVAANTIQVRVRGNERAGGAK